MRTRNKVLIGLLVWPLGIYWALKGAGASRTASIVSASVASEERCRQLLVEIDARGVTLADGREGWALIKYKPLSTE